MLPKRQRHVAISPLPSLSGLNFWRLPTNLDITTPDSLSG